MNNVTVVNAGCTGLQANAGTKIILRNGLIMGNGYFASGCYGLQAYGGEIDYDYSLITGNGLLPSSNIKSTSGTLTDGGHNKVEYLPHITSWQKGNVGKFNLHLSIDDGNTTDAIGTAEYLAANLALEPVMTMDTVVYPVLTKVADLVELQDDHGWEIASHTWSHFYLNNTYPFTVTSTTNTDNPLFIVDTTGKTVSLTHTAGTNNCSQPYTNTNGYNDTGTINDFITACTGKGWTISMGTFNYATATISKQMKLKALAATAGTAVPTSGTTCQALVDSTALIAAEITDSKAWFADQVVNGLDAPIYFQYPNGSQNDTIRTAVKDAGYIGAMSNATGGASFNLSSFDAYRHQYFDGPTAKGGGTDAEIDAWAIHDYVRTMSVGGVHSMSYHGTAQISNAQLARYIGKMQELGVTFETSGAIITAIRASHSTADGGITWTKTYPDLSNYHLLYNSPAIDSGVDISLTSDTEGNKIYGIPDIGSYEYQPPHTMGTDKIDIGAGARIYGDGKFRDLETTNLNTADLKITPNGGTFSETTSPIPAFLDVSINTWDNTGSHHKNWTESNAEALLNNTEHTIGDLEANKYYNLTVDSGINNLSGCSTVGSNYVCQANAQGKIAFTYIGGYSTHTFDVLEGANTDTNITSFDFASPSTTGTVNNTNHTVALTVPYGTTVTSLTPTIVLATGATISPNTGVAQDFTTPQTYTVTAQDGTTTQNYTVTVTIADNTSDPSDDTDDPTSATTTLERVKIKFNKTINKFKDTLRITEKKFKLKSQDDALSNGQVKVYKGSKLWKTISVDANGAWSKTLKLANDTSKKVKVLFYDSIGNLLGKQTAKIKVDTEKPKFTKFITPFYSIKKGDTLYWEAEDNQEIKKYKITFNGKTKNVKKARFTVPVATPNGTYSITVKAYDKAGNTASKKGWVRVR